MKIDWERSAILPESVQVAKAIEGIVLPFIPSKDLGCDRRDFIPKNVTLKEVSRALGDHSPTEVEKAIQSPITHRSGAVGSRAGLEFVDTQGSCWGVYVGSPGRRQSKEVARKIGNKYKAPRDGIQEQMERGNQTVNTTLAIFEIPNKGI